MTRLILAAAIVLWGNGAGAASPELLCNLGFTGGIECHMKVQPVPAADGLLIGPGWQGGWDNSFGGPIDPPASEAHRCAPMRPGMDICITPLPGSELAKELPPDLDHALQICERHRHTEFPDWWGGNRPPAATLVYDDDFAALCTALQHRRDAADLDEVKRAAGEKP